MCDYKDFLSCKRKNQGKCVCIFCYWKMTELSISLSAVKHFIGVGKNINT